MIFDFTTYKKVEAVSGDFDIMTWRNYQKAVTQVLSIPFPIKKDKDRLSLIKYVLRDPVGPAILVPACRASVRPKVEDMVFWGKKTGLSDENVSAMAKLILELDNPHHKHEFGNKEDND